MLLVLPLACDPAAAAQASGPTACDPANVNQHVEGERSPWQWQRTEISLALRQGPGVVWQFNWGADLDVPYFHPLCTVSGQVLSQDQPPDHVWHHGLWFSWKFIDGVNYWEPNPRTRRPDGRTSWSEPVVQTREDGSAVISMHLEYGPATGGQIVLREQRRIELAPPDSHRGQYQVDWTSSFTAPGADVVLDRTPPREQSSGGYAGLSLRFAPHFTERSAVTTAQVVPFGVGGRYRGRALAVDYAGVINGQLVGAAFLDHSDNPRHPTPWYLIAREDMSYLNASLLSERPLVLKSGDRMTLQYRLIVHQGRWDAARLQEVHARFVRASSPVGK
jgi:hypothetical protein